MTEQQRLPFAMIVLSAMAALVYMKHGDLRHTIYWISSALLIWSVTF